MNDSIGDLIKKTRQDKNMTKGELAKSLGISIATVTKWEKNIAKPSFSYLLLIGKELDLELDEIILGHTIDKKNRKSSDEELKKIVKKNIKYKNFFNVFAGIFICLCLCFLEAVLYKNHLVGSGANYIFLLIILMIYMAIISEVLEKSNLLEEKNKYKEHFLFLFVGFVIVITGFVLVVLK